MRFLEEQKGDHLSGTTTFVILGPFTVLYHLLGIIATFFTGLLRLSSISTRIHYCSTLHPCEHLLPLSPSARKQKMQGTNLLLSYNICKSLLSVQQHLTSTQINDIDLKGEGDMSLPKPSQPSPLLIPFYMRTCQSFYLFICWFHFFSIHSHSSYSCSFSCLPVCFPIPG